MSTVTLFDPIKTGQMYIDPISGGSYSIPIAHAKIHEGKLFNFNYTASVNNAANADLLLRVGAKPLHLSFSAEMVGQYTLTIYEAPTTSANGTAITIVNNNRLSANLPLSAVGYTPTVSVVGTSIWSKLGAGGTTTPTRTQVQTGVRQDEELILLPNTNYLIRMNNSSTATQTVSLNFDFYEG